MNKSIIIALLCAISFLNVNSQNKDNDSIRITGVVFEMDSLNTLPYARYNVEKTDFISDDKGRFSFWAHQGEVVRFTHLGYKDTYIQINDSLLHRNYMVGVFLARDTFLISEVIVMPRYENISLQAKTMPLVIKPEMAYATNNIRSSTRQALTQAPLKMDAEINHRMVLQEHVWSTIYKTQIPPSSTIGVSSENIAQMRLFVPKNKQKIMEVTQQPLNRNELDLILRIYEERAKKNAPIP
jgi:hypothetical protein